eukprot:361271-Chlamydomonas_euryale.AAC.4
MGLGHCTCGVEICCDCPIVQGQRSAVIAPSYKGKDPRDAAGSCRGIGLLSIAGKVYARLLLHSTVEQIEP